MTPRIGRPPNASPDEIAAMLTAGATMRQVVAALHVSHTSVTKVRHARGIPLVSRALADRPPGEQRATVEARHPRITAMLRAGATHAQIQDETGCARETIVRVRTALGLPTPPPAARPPATVAEALARYVQPYGEDHARWTGPTSRKRGQGQPQLWAEGGRGSARRAIFRAHHGRDPDGHVLTTCTEPRCIAGPHLADRIHRQGEPHLDAQYAAIFGPEAT